MVKYAYVTTIGKLKDFLQKIRTTGTPPKCTAKWLSMTGFTSSNDRLFLPVLKELGLIQQDGTPSDLWKQYRGPNHREVLANCIKQAYTSLFNTYPDACKQDRATLTSFFNAETGKSMKTVTCIVSTFLGLCELADFGSVVLANMEGNPSDNSKTTVIDSEEHNMVSTLTKGIPAINININLALPESKDAEVYEKLFSSLSKHILSK